MVNKILCSLAIIASSLTGCTSRPDSITPIANIPEEVDSNKYLIHIGDSIEVFVLEDSSFNGTFEVRSSGDIIMPKVGRISLEGLSLKDAEAQIKRSLESNNLRTATVIVDPGSRELADNGVIVRMSGAIVQTGRITIKRLGSNYVTAYQAVVEAGGFKAFANKRKGYLLRQGADGLSRINIDFTAIENDEQEDVILISGDCIVVPEKLIGF